jgi:MYXO-CTERM domain-containing protein
VPTSGADDTGDTNNSGDTDPDQDDGGDTISCTCRSDAPPGRGGLLTGLGVLLVRRRRRAERDARGTAVARGEDDLACRPIIQ